MRLVILGVGGHGRVVAETARVAGLDLLGFIDEDRALHTATPLGLPVLGSTTAVEHRQIDCDGVLLGVGRNSVRIALLRRFLVTGHALPALIHPRAWVSPNSFLGPGTVVMANATVQTGCRLGAAVIINTNASIDHDGVLADGVHISPGAHLAGNVAVGEGTHIGIGATVIEGIRIGAGCLVAAGAVVIRDVLDGQRVAGVPARPMRSQERV
ncbi:MAG: acetyltransferase [Planctomycetes bacterium]|nr:acetyltransferase [Planctomycetota bacterium]